ncbi:MAG: DUF3306 domain-containing protein [Lysobacter sp.]|nr:DUF3306 domain-containing protein [Lysobacter sp.]
MAAEDNFLSRWSRRKIEARAGAVEAPPPVAPVATPAAPAADATPPASAPAGREPLPPVESLTPESDFTPFMNHEVDGETRSKALKALFTDPHFNTMDMMDVYVDDYSKPDPIPASWMDKLEQLSHLGDKGGRDREEAERQRALAEAQAGGEPAPAGTPPAPADTPPVAAAENAADGPGGEPAPKEAIPPRPEGESGT